MSMYELSQGWQQSWDLLQQLLDRQQHCIAAGQCWPCQLVQVLDARVFVTVPPAPDEQEAPDTPKAKQLASGEISKLISAICMHPELESTGNM